MPAAAVTPAPVAYIKVVAVKKLVVGFLARIKPSCAFRSADLVFLAILRRNQFGSLLSFDWVRDLLL